ncbi:MAG: HAD family hydrolase [Firmicutes bacterium]|nr:HAD family hydrolase [Bacillota bacterium]
MLFGESVAEVDAVIFDKDGTLFDARVMLSRLGAERFRLMKEAGVGPDGLQWAARAVGFDLEKQIVHSTGPLALATSKEEAVAAATGLCLSGYAWIEARKIALDAYERAEKQIDVASMTDLCEGVSAALTALKSHGLMLGIVTTDTRDRSRRMLEQAGIAGLFDVVVGSEDYRSPKPDPEPILKACEKLGITPGKCAYVGDSVSDMNAARNAGTKLRVGVLTGFGDASILRSLADVVLRSAADIRPGGAVGRSVVRT